MDWCKYDITSHDNFSQPIHCMTHPFTHLMYFPPVSGPNNTIRCIHVHLLWYTLFTFILHFFDHIKKFCLAAHLFLYVYMHVFHWQNRKSSISLTPKFKIAMYIHVYSNYLETDKHVFFITAITNFVYRQCFASFGFPCLNATGVRTEANSV